MNLTPQQIAAVREFEARFLADTIGPDADFDGYASDQFWELFT